MLNHCLSWSDFVNTHLSHSRQWFKTYTRHKYNNSQNLHHSLAQTIMLTMPLERLSSCYGLNKQTCSVLHMTPKYFSQHCQRLEAVIRRGIRSGLCAPEHMSLEHLVTDADDKLFNLILHARDHVYTVYFLVVQILIIILGQGVTILS